MSFASISVLLIVAASITWQEVYTLDKTLVSGENRSHVVRAVISKIVFSNITSLINDSSRHNGMVESFMRIMAYVETRDGTQPSLQSGGIWNISECYFNEVKQQFMNNSIAVELEQNHNENFIKVNPNDVVYQNLSIPLYSGLFARLFILQYKSQNLSVNEFDNYWINVFKKSEVCEDIIEDSSKWTNDAKNLTDREQKECTVNTDLVFVLDESGSIRLENFTRVKSFVYNFSREFLQRNTTKSRVGVITFSDSARERIALNSSIGHNDSEVLRQIQELPYSHGGTNTAAALDLMRQQAWRDEVTVLRLAIVITDGKSRGRLTNEAAKRVHQHTPHILVYALGVGWYININELLNISSRPETFAYLDSFDTNSLYSVGTVFSYQICFTESQLLDINGSESGSLNRDVTAQIRYLIPVVSGMTLRFCLTSGRIIIYASTLPNPSSAQYNKQSEVAANALSLNCLTMFFELPTESNEQGRKRREASSDLETLYITLEGQDDENVFSISSREGNVTIDINECEQEPCHHNEECINTDGSFFCMFSANQDNGTITIYPAVVDDNLAVILSLTFMVAVVGIVMVVFITIFIILRYRYCAKEINKQQLEKGSGSLLFEQDSLNKVNKDVNIVYGPDRLVPTLVKKFESMAADAQDDKILHTVQSKEKFADRVPANNS